MLITDEGAIPAASLWIGSRLWVRAFRAAGLQPGDRVVLALEPSAAFVEVLVAALWEGLTVAPTAPGADTRATLALLDGLDAVVAVVPDPPDPAGETQAGSLPAGIWAADGCSGPRSPLAPPRRARSAPTPSAAMLLRSSGTAGDPHWVALSERNICAVLDSHQPPLALTDAYVVSVLPWHHAFGLILDLLPALLAGAYIARDPSGGRSAGALAELVRQAPAVLCAVPETIAALAALPDGPALIAGLAGGIIGGARVGPELAGLLAGSTLRVGYGQTEASPGIALGEPGRWQANLLGSALGCEVRVVAGELEFRGPNACLGSWEAGGLRVLDPRRWVATHDAVDLVEGELFFRGRCTDRFKLTNGRWVETTALEARLSAALPAAIDVVLFTPDGSTLDVLAVFPPDAEPDGPASEAVVRTVLGLLSERLGRVHRRTAREVAHTPKGAIDRIGAVRELLGG